MGEVGFGLIDRAVFFQEHVAGCCRRRGFAVVDKNLFVGLGEVNQHEAAAANIAGPRQCYGEREPCRHGRINGVAALLEHVEADLAGQLLRAHHHAGMAIGREVTVLIIDDGRVSRRHRRQGALGTDRGRVAQHEYRVNSEQRGGQASDEGVG